MQNGDTHLRGLAFGDRPSPRRCETIKVKNRNSMNFVIICGSAEGQPPQPQIMRLLSVNRNTCNRRQDNQQNEQNNGNANDNHHALSS